MIKLHSLASAGQVLAVAAAVLLPPPDISVSEWAETYRVLSREDSAAPGRWRTEARPYQVEIMDACSTPSIQYVSVVGGAQWGKTQILNNILGHRIHLNPGPLMVVQPTEKAAEKWSKTRLAPMIRDCPELTALVGEAKTRDGNNTILEKIFPGGLLVAVGANAPAGLASQPIRDLLMDEVDRIGEAASAGDEGDFEELAEARTSDFEGRRLIYRCSTPTIKNHSRIEKSWNESDQRKWHVPCPHCGHEQVLNFHQVQFKDLPPEEIHYACSGAGCVITEPELRRAVKAGRWIATRPEIKDHAGFHVSGLMVRPMATLVGKFLRAKARGRGALQVFVNTQLGEWWDLRDGDAIQVEGLMTRREEWTSGTVPDGVGLLVLSVDVQTEPQRLEVMVLGVGAAEETWVILHEIIPGNLTMAEPWDRLEALIRKEWLRADGQVFRIKAATCDIGGHFTRQVYQFARRPGLRGLVFPVKGNSKPQQKLVRRSGAKSRLWLVDTVAAKDQVHGRLRIAKPGPGYIHYPQDLGQEFFEQLLAERAVPRAGRRAYEKITTDARNEALDLMVYAAAALEIYAPRDLEALVRKAAGGTAASAAAGEGEPAVAKVRQVVGESAGQRPRSPAAKRPPSRRGGGMTGFG